MATARVARPPPAAKSRAVTAVAMARAFERCLIMGRLLSGFCPSRVEDRRRRARGRNPDADVRVSPERRKRERGLSSMASFDDSPGRDIAMHARQLALPAAVLCVALAACHDGDSRSPGAGTPGVTGTPGPTLEGSWVITSTPTNSSCG